MVSVIISYYNEKDVLTACLISLTAQTHPDFEIIAVDDGSTDNSKKIVQNAILQFKLKKLTLLTQQQFCYICLSTSRKKLSPKWQEF